MFNTASNSTRRVRYCAAAGRIATAAFLLAVAASPPRASSDDWPRWRGPRGDGVSREHAWRDDWTDTPPHVLWQTDVHTGFSSLAVARGRLVTLGNRENRETVWCLDATTGVVQWKHTYECPLDDRFFEGGPTATPAIDQDRVYTLSRPGELTCFALETGHVQWSVDLPEATGVRVPGWGFSGSPVVHQDRLILTAGEAGIAVDKHSGRVLWASREREAGYATPVLFRHGADWLALIPSGRHYSAVDVATGEIRWQHRWLTRFGCNAADPIVDGSRCLLSSGYNRGTALLDMPAAPPDQPDVLWTSKAFQNQLHSSVRIGGHVYGIDGNAEAPSHLKCLEWSTGNVTWETPWSGLGSLIAAGGKLIILSESGQLHVVAADPQQFRSLAQARVLRGKCWTMPVLAHGLLYCRSADGTLVCLDLRNAEAGAARHPAADGGQTGRTSPLTASKEQG